MKHIKRDFSLKAWVHFPGVDLGVRPRPKLNLFGIRSCCISNKSQCCMQQHGSKYFARRHTLDPGGGVNRSKFNFFRNSHVAYQIKGN